MACMLFKGFFVCVFLTAVTVLFMINCEGQCQQAFLCNLQQRCKQEVCSQNIMLLTQLHSVIRAKKC